MLFSQDLNLKTIQVPVLLGFKLINLKVASLRAFTGPSMSYVLTSSNIKMNLPNFDPKNFKNNIWNWPVGLANNLFFAVLFWKARLFADFGLQGIYLILGIYGWWEWLRGGENHTRLAISRSSRSEWIGIAVFLVIGTWGLREILQAANGSAPLWDAVTTALSLSAQYLLCRKRIENWFFWIAADVIYVPLYLSKQLPLTALLYGGFLVLCVIGWRRWRKEIGA